MAKFNIIGIAEPGKVNVLLNGAFTDVELFSASDDDLEQLYNAGIPYVQLSPNEFLKRNPDAAEIKIEPIQLGKSKTATPTPE